MNTTTQKETRPRVILMTESAAIANLDKLRKLPPNYDLVVVRDCDYQAALEVFMWKKH